MIMDWIENEVNKRIKINYIKLKVCEFWEKLLLFNANLPKEIRLTHNSRKLWPFYLLADKFIIIDHYEYYIKDGLVDEGLFLRNPTNCINDFILYDDDDDMYYLKYLSGNEHYDIYEIDDLSIPILFRNLMTKRKLPDDLRLKSGSYNIFKMINKLDK
jgi:hypothetical protein